MIIFFIHKFNDVDHMAPIVYKIAKDSKEKLQVLCLNPHYDIYNDFRLKYLKKTYEVPIDYFYLIHKPTLFYKLLGSLLCDHIINNPQNTPSVKLNIYLDWWRILRSISSKIFIKIMHVFKVNIGKLILNIYNEEWVNGFYKQMKPSVLIFDHATHSGLYNLPKLIKVANNFSIPTLDVPHGIPLYLKHPKRWDKAKYSYINNVKDHMVLHHKWWKQELIDLGLDRSNTPILGSARYCKEWHNILDSILQPDTTLNGIGRNKLKVLYMDLPHYKEYNHTLSQSLIEKISNLDFVTLIVKPQTRKNKLTIQSSNKNFYTAISENSVNLIKWADVVIVLFSSILLEVLNRKKVLLYPKYMHKNEMIHEQFNASWTLNSEQEVIEAVAKLKENYNFRPYTQNNVDQFINNVVYNGPDDDVLGAYLNYIIKVKKEFSKFD